MTRTRTGNDGTRLYGSLIVSSDLIFTTSESGASATASTSKTSALGRGFYGLLIVSSDLIFTTVYGFQVDMSQ